MIPDADLASLMKQMPGMVHSQPVSPAHSFEKPLILLWTIVTVPGWQPRHLIQQGHTRIGYLYLTTLFLTPKIVCKGIDAPC